MMSKKIINPPDAPQPIGPYNQAVKIDNLVYTSGQIAIDPQTNQMIQGDVTVQTRRVLTNLKAVLQGAGSSLDRVIKVCVFLKSMNDFGAMNAVYGEFFTPPTAPARSTVEVARLPRDALVEIEAVAIV